MLISLFYLVAPLLEGLAYSIIELAIFGIVIFFGFCLVLSSIGLKVNATSSVLKAFRRIGREIISIFRWLFKKFCLFVPWLFKKLKKFFDDRGISPTKSNVLAGVFTILIVALII